MPESVWLLAVVVGYVTLGAMALAEAGQFLLFAFAFDPIKHPRKVWGTFAGKGHACLFSQQKTAPGFPGASVNRSSNGTD